MWFIGVEAEHHLLIKKNPGSAPVFTTATATKTRLNCQHELLTRLARSRLSDCSRFFVCVFMDLHYVGVDHKNAKHK